MLIIYILVSIGCAIACAMIADKKGRSALGWFFVGLMFGLLGLIIALVVSDERPRYSSYSYDAPPKPIERLEARNSTTTSTAPPALSSVPTAIQKWQVLKEVDPDVMSAAQQVARFGAGYETALAEKYMTLGQKEYLSALVANITRDAEQSEAKERERAAQAGAQFTDAATKELEAFEADVAQAGGVDPVSGKRVLSVEAYQGRWVGFQGGIKVVLADLTVLLIRGGVRREFPSSEGL